MVPDPPEIAILVFICLAITGLLKLDTLGEWVWRIRCALSPSLEQSTGGSGPNAERSDRQPNPDHTDEES